MTVLDELAEGRTGPAFVALLRRSVLAVAVTRNFPPPSGATWTPDEVSAVVAEFLADRQTPRRLADLALHCLDDRAVARRLQAAVRNFLRDRGRATDVGRLVVRLRRALRESAEFVHVGDDRWTLVDGNREPSTATPEKLARAADAVEIVHPAWSAMARRRAPFAEKASIDGLLRAVLWAADGSILVGDIAAAVAPRLAVVPRPLLVEADVGDFPDDADVVGADTTGEEAVNRLRAQEVISLLTDRERIALAYAGLPVRDLGPKMGVKGSQAHVIRQRAVAVLRGELLGEDGGERVAEIVIEMAKMLADGPDMDRR